MTGLLLIAMLTATISAVLGVAIAGLPLWSVLVIYPSVGATSLLLGAAFVYARDEAKRETDTQRQPAVA